MAAKGKKHICKNCRRPYFDLGKKVHKCPNCKQKTAPNKKSKETEKSQDTSLLIELFEVTDATSGKGYSVSSGILKLSFPTIRTGWHAVIGSEIKNKEIKNKDALIYFNEPTLKGLETYLSSVKFKGVGAVTSKGLIADHNVGVLKTLGGSSEFIETELDIKEDLAKSLYNGWSQKPEEHIFMIIMNELGFLEMQIREITKTLGADVIAVLNNNPFSLVKALPRFEMRDVDRV